MEEKIKAYCEWEYENCLWRGYSVEKAIDRCFGAVTFCINFCFPTYNKKLADWWSDEMLPQFKNIRKNS